MLKIRRASIALVGMVGVILTTSAIPFELATASSAPDVAVQRRMSTSPATGTPFLDPSVPLQNVRQLRQCGGIMYAVGKFSSIATAHAKRSRDNAFSFSIATGKLTNWAPRVNGEVNSIALSPNCRTAYLGGEFTRVNDKSAANLAAVGTGQGGLLGGFAHRANDGVETLQYTDGRVLVGGRFTSINGVQRSMMASLDPKTGAATRYLRLAIDGHYADGAATKVYNSQLSHQGTRMLIEGIFTSIGGKARQQIAMLRLGTSEASVAGWHAPGFHRSCKIPAFYAKAAAWSPDDSSIYVASTGWTMVGAPEAGPRQGFCDSVSAFPSSPGAAQARWVNYTGCDSLYTVAASATAVYVGGHERWANNAGACDSPGPGAVSRPGIGAISPTTGLATGWNPTRARGHGADDMLLTPAGLWVASDNGSDGTSQRCGGLDEHGGICFFPINRKVDQKP